MRSLRRPNWRAMVFRQSSPDGPNWGKAKKRKLSIEVLQSWSPCPHFLNRRWGDFRSQWQATDWFRAAPLEYADKLVAAVMQRLAVRFHQPAVGLGKAVVS